MKTQLLKVFGLLILVTVILSSCEMADTNIGWNGLADGAKLPAVFAIASGEPIIMLECLAGLRTQFNEGGLSDLERGEIALDMIDLLAVLSDVIFDLVPYLIEGVPPADLTVVEDFLESADPGFLGQIALEELMVYGMHSDPSPLQLFWSLLSLILIQDEYPAPVFSYNDWEPSDQAMYDQIINSAVEQGAKGTNVHFLPLLVHFRTFITDDPNP